MKQISLNSIRVILEVYVIKNPTCFSRWSVSVTSTVINEVKKILNNDGENQGGVLYTKNIQLSLTCNECVLKAIVEVFTFVKNGVVKTWFGSCSGDIAFDHAKIIYYSLQRLRGKAEYTSIVFNLMPELFTLTELQQSYEIILDKELLTANFRRKISDMVIKTNHQKKDKGHRPSQLFRFNIKWLEENLI